MLLAGRSTQIDGSSDQGVVHPVRVPPVHELLEPDLPFLERLLQRTRFLVSQPVRDGYRALPLGTGQLAGMLPPGATVLRVPIVRYLGLHPYQAIVRHPSDPAAVPAGVPYHDLRIIAAVRDGLSRPVAIERASAVAAAPAALRAVGEISQAELIRRERDCDLAVSDLLDQFGVEAAHTVNHPGNPVLIEMARRVQAALGLPVVAADPGRVLLGQIRAPLEPAMLAARGLGSPAREHWLVSGAPLVVADLVPQQMAWYGDHPQFVAAGLARHAERLSLLSL